MSHDLYFTRPRFRLSSPDVPEAVRAGVRALKATGITSDGRGTQGHVKVLIGIAVVLGLALMSGCGSDAAVPQSSSTSTQSAGPGLRNMILTTDPAELAFVADGEFPVVYGVVVDWPIDDVTATIVALRDGNASVYTTSTFGILGGSGHEKVRDAARACVLLAGDFVKACEPTTDYPYPPGDTVYYYLLTYSGVKRCSASLAALEKGSDPTFPLFDAAQDVVTELRLVVAAQDAAGGAEAPER